MPTAVVPSSELRKGDIAVGYPTDIDQTLLFGASNSEARVGWVVTALSTEDVYLVHSRDGTRDRLPKHLYPSLVVVSPRPSEEIIPGLGEFCLLTQEETANVR